MLSNLSRREFRAQLDTPKLDATFSSVEGLYQGLKFNLPEQFAKGGALHGAAGSAALEAASKGSAEKLAKKSGNPASEGLTALMASRMFGDKLKALQKHARALKELDRTRPAAPTLVDAGLCLLACQLLMLSQNGEAAELLLKTGEAPLEEYCDRSEGEFWARYRGEPPAFDSAPVGENANGQNLMHARALLRAGGAAHAGACARKLLAQLWPAMAGDELMSKYSSEFYADAAGASTYAALLEKAAPVGAVQVV